MIAPGFPKYGPASGIKKLNTEGNGHQMARKLSLQLHHMDDAELRNSPHFADSETAKEFDLSRFSAEMCATNPDEENSKKMARWTFVAMRKIARRHKKSSAPRISTGIFAAAIMANVGLGGLPAMASAIGIPEGWREAPSSRKGTDISVSGLRLLKAQMNAMQKGLENFEQLKKFFEESRSDTNSIVRNAERLIKLLPQHEDAGDAAWRIAAVATLSSHAGRLASLKIGEDYQLPAGAIGWDFGATGSPIHKGFTPLTPDIMNASGNSGREKAVAGQSALTDGIVGLSKFQSSLPNGMYRILIVANPESNPEEGGNPFGNRITVNGDPLGGNGLSNGSTLESRDLGSFSGDKLASASGGILRRTALGLGVDSWAIVRNGKLEIDFDGLPEGRAISAVIAEPIDMDRMALDPEIAETLASAFSSLSPAAGPDPRMGSRGNSSSGNGNGGGRGNSGQASAFSQTVASPAVRRVTAPVGRPSFIRSFNDSRNRSSNSGSSAIIAQGPVASPQIDSSTPGSTGVTGGDNFFDRQLLVQQGGDGTSSAGLAVDLGALLDNGSVTGTFLCQLTPCGAGEFVEITDEPDLSAAQAALGDWLSNPNNLVEGWQDVGTILDNWASGNEIAILYTFDINVDLWTDVELRANASDGILVWLDGVFVFGATGPGTFNDEAGYTYRIQLPDLAGGSHVLQIVAESRGPGAPHLNFELRGTPVTNSQQPSTVASVPEPYSFALFGLGLACLSAFRRRRPAS